MLLRMVKKRPKKFLEIFKAVKIHAISKGLATPTNLFTTGKFEGCSLHGVIRGLSVEMSTEKPSFLNTLKPLQKVENDVSQAL